MLVFIIIEEDATKVVFAKINFYSKNIDLHKH